MIAAGIGCRAGCPASDIVAALELALAEHGIAPANVCALFSAEFKATDTALRAAARELDKPLVLLSRAVLAAQAEAVLSRSSQVLRRFGLPSVAETAALAGARALAEQAAPAAPAAPPLAELLSKRVIRGGAACALARAKDAA